MQDFQSNPSTAAAAVARARVSRKGSGASRSSRSRSSPRLAGRNQLTNTTSSSDEGKQRRKGQQVKLQGCMSGFDLLSFSSRLVGAGDRFGDDLYVDCANLPLVSGRNLNNIHQTKHPNFKLC